MIELLDVITKLAGTIGPVGVFCLLVGILYIQATRTKLYHRDNTQKLDTIAITSAAASASSAETLRVVNLMNGRLIRLEEWRNIHDQDDKERFKELKEMYIRLNERKRNAESS